jgi:hypothetical protein
VPANAKARCNCHTDTPTASATVRVDKSLSVRQRSMKAMPRSRICARDTSASILDRARLSWRS